MYEIKIENAGVMRTFDRLARAGQAHAPMMRAISIEFLSQTEANLEAEGRPKWMGLKPSTIAARAKRGTWPGKIMQVSGQLAASFTPGSDSDSAWIGSNKKYAAIQHAGGKAGRGKKTTIPARPSLPVDAQGNLQPEAEESILGIASDYLRRVI